MPLRRIAPPSNLLAAHILGDRRHFQRCHALNDGIHHRVVVGTSARAEAFELRLYVGRVLTGETPASTGGA